MTAASPPVRPGRLWWLAIVMLLLLLVWLLLPTRQTLAPAEPQQSVTAPIANKHLASGTRPVKPEKAPVSGAMQSTGNALQLSEQLKWQLDDVIHAADGDEAKLPSLLHALAQRLALSAAAGQQLSALFYRYRDYLLAIAELKQTVDIESLLTLDDTRHFLRRAHKLQYEFFSDAEIAAFFGDANRYDEQALQRMAGRRGNSADALQQQLDTLPEYDRQVLQPSVDALAISESLAGSSAPAGLSLPQQEMLANLQAQNQQWQQRVRAVTELQQQLAGTDSADLQLAQYLTREFTATERRRLDVFLRHPELLNSQGNE